MVRFYVTHREPVIIAVESTDISTAIGGLMVETWRKFDFEDLSFPNNLAKFSKLYNLQMYHFSAYFTEGFYRPRVALPSQLLNVHPDFKHCQLDEQGK